MAAPLELAMAIEHAFADRDLDALAALWSDDIEDQRAIGTPFVG